MIDVFTSDPLELEPDDVFTVVDDIRVGDIVYFLRVAPHEFHLKTVQENEIASVKEPKYRVERAGEVGGMALISYDPHQSITSNVGEKVMSENTQDKVANHLEFLGFEVERQDSQLFAKHPSKSNMFVRFFEEGMMLSIYYICTDTAKQAPQRLLEYVNTLNAKTLATRFFLDEDQDVNLVAFYPGDYDKLSFARFLQYWETDFDKMADLPETTQYLK